MNTENASALVLRDEFVGSTFYGKGTKALGTVQSTRYLKSLNAKGRTVQRGVEVTLLTESGEWLSKEYRLNDRVSYTR